MKTMYVYPILFTWDRIIPAEYPWVNIRGPKGCEGVLMVFEDQTSYMEFANTQSTVYHSPLIIQQPEKGDLDGEQNRCDGKGEGANSLQGAGSGSQAGQGGQQADGMAQRGRKRARKDVGGKGSSRSGW